MRIKSIEVENFRAIAQVQLANLNDVVVVAGPNGSGKSCILDAMRLLKSAYGGYHPNEWQQWGNEFQIDFTSPEDCRRLLRDKQRPMRVSVEIELAISERTYFTENARSLLTEATQRAFEPRPGPGVRHVAPLGTAQQTIDQDIQATVEGSLNQLLQELTAGVFRGSLEITPDGTVRGTDSQVLEILFSLYQPESLGIIDYHGPQRNYAREQVGGINLGIDSQVQQLSQHALYNSGNKYSNIKTQLAREYVRELLAREAGTTGDQGMILTAALKELFAAFFPDKRFEGPRPTGDGRLVFEVVTEDRAVHDVDDLSSGEKEVLYGYLRLRTSAPRNSVLLIDEPELHLNPALVRNLPSFYRKYLGEALGNQLWLITHSDALLRHAVNREGFSVFHMTPARSVAKGANQAQPVQARTDIERAVFDLIGDLASYQPNAGVVIVEGGGDSNFDVSMISDLFPEILSKANLISAGNKHLVQALHDVLERASADGALAGVRFYSVTDKDSDDDIAPTGPRFRWDRYHIENYLLEPTFIRKVLMELHLPGLTVPTEDDIETALYQHAAECLPGLIGAELGSAVYRELRACLDTGIDPNSTSIASQLHQRAVASSARLADLVSKFDSATLARNETAIAKRLQSDLDTGDWRNTFPGRTVLTRFVAVAARGAVRYEIFRNLIIARMKDAGFRPAGMKSVVEEIIQSEVAYAR